MNNYFDGTYYKHQKDDNTLCLIAGRSDSGEFIQVITSEFSASVPSLEGNQFTDRGVSLNIHSDDIMLTGEISYGALSPIRYDIMGPFRFLPMQCRHGIISMRHGLNGSVSLNGKEIDFTGGKGYIEKDSGRSFPKSYVWVHANDFSVPCSVMASVAHIPFCGFSFQGCICVIQYHDREYRLATYLGVKVRECTRERITLQQGEYRLEIQMDSSPGQHSLSAPERGQMTRTILETASCPAVFTFYQRDKKIFNLHTEHASFEFEA